MLATAGEIDTTKARGDSVPIAAPGPSAAQLAGQRVVVGFRGTTPPTGLVTRIRRGETGAVIIMGANVESRSGLARLAAHLQAIPRPPGLDEPLLIMTDQEGGLVRRVPGPPRRSAALMGRGTPPSTRATGRATGRLLTSVGVNVALAPVSDIAGPGSKLLRSGRIFGASRAGVSSHAVAFAAGLRDGGVLATAKHFPGFGAARANTDDEPVVIARSRARLRALDMAPFSALIGGGVPMVMTSSAIYPALAPDTPALLSRRVVTGELRNRLGFGGVIVTDALDTPALAAVDHDGPVSVRATAAGNDLLIYIDRGRGERAAAALTSAIAAGRLDRGEAERSLERVLALRRSLR